CRLSLRDALPILAVVVVAPALAPQIGRLDRRHQDLERAGAVLLLADDLVHLVEHALAQWKPRKASGRLLPDHAGAQHQPVRGDFGLARILLQDGQEITGQTHEESVRKETARPRWESRGRAETACAS